MRFRILLVVLLVLCAVLAVIGLLSGAAWLVVRLPGGLPIGNALVALVFVLVAGAALVASNAGTIARKVARVGMTFSLLWLPVSLAMAGNLDLNFGGSRATLWLVMTAVVLMASFGSLFFALNAVLVARRLRGRRG